MQLGTANTKPFKERDLFRHQRMGHSVFKAGSGPGVLLMHELPGMTPEFWRLANWLAEGFTVWAPDLFGHGKRPTKPTPAALTMRACISRQIHLFAKDDPGPITQWLRALSKELHDEVGGEGIGVIGMCMTGNFALTLALDPWVSAPVSSQPAMPASLPLRPLHGKLQMSMEDQTALAARDVDVMGLRFEGDRLCRAARFDAIRDLIGEPRFKEHVIADKHGHPDGPLGFPHSVLTADLVDADDSVTKAKLGEVIRFLSERIG